ncbi:hypothetical protein DPEC_G00051010 [Dallia pectoralis]|uniref:Uncharacterized protein n=1 Tax=Dallia pectoralis TaxID=75939 RepID=A0ACC2HC09_DALPE|nr:hypothetical protein DPEC_G00051010 [Dallia pectoralis]
MQTTDIGNKEEGKIWHRKPTPINGVIVNVIHSAAAYQSKIVRFLHITFDATGESFLAGDHHGNIYVFDISANRFRLVQSTGQACTALAFSLRRTTEFLVALADNSVKCFDKDTKQLVSWMRGHEGAVSSVSVHGSGRYAITTSADTAQLWDMDTFQRKRKLNVRQCVGIQRVFFIPLSNSILSCFSDDSIFAWESDTLFCKYQLPVPDHGPRVHYKAFAITRDGKTLAAGGRSNLLHLWCLETRQLLQVIQMPPTVRTVRQLDFLPDSFDGGSTQTLGVLSQDGIMRFINIHTCKLLFSIGTHDNAITSAAISPSGRHVVTITDNGGLTIYLVQSLTQDYNKPPPPLVKVVSSLTASAPTVKIKSQSIQRPAKTSSRSVRTKVLWPAAISVAEEKENELPDGLNQKRLVALLKAFGEYPAKYRMFVWRSLLRLPENHAAFSSLTDKGLHSAYLRIQERYPIKSQKLQRGLQRVLSALAHWAAIFGETEYLPLVAFPFVKLFQNNPLLCFEVVATIIVNWCQHWFEYFPNPPLNVLSMAENVLAHHDKQLLQHLINCGVTSQLYVWPLLETLFSEVLTREEWLKLFDNVFSNHPAFLLVAVVSYVTSCRAPLLLCRHKEDFEYFFHHRNNLDISTMIRETYRMMEGTPDEIHPRNMLDDFQPLTRGPYPIFNKYPAYIVEYQSQEREKIRQQEMEFLRERQTLQELRGEAVRRQAEDEAWYTQQDLLQQAEGQRRNILQQEENKLSEQRTRLAAMKRELKVKELQLMDAARRRFLKHQQDQRLTDLQRLDDQIQRKVNVREQESEAAVQEAEVRQMELETKRRLFEHQLSREQLRVTQKVRAELDTRTHRSEVETATVQQHLNDDTGLRTNQVLEESLAEAGQLSIDTDWQAEVLRRLEQDDICQDNHYHYLSRLQRETRAKEDQLINVMKEMEGKRWEEVVAQKAKLEEERLAADTAEAHKRVFLSQDEEEESQHRDKLHRSQNPSHCRQWEGRARSPCSTKGLLVRPAASGPTEPSTPFCLNNQSPTASASCERCSPQSILSFSSVSSDRGRAELDSRERELMQDIRELRQKLVARAKNSNTPTSQSLSSQ